MTDNVRSIISLIKIVILAAVIITAYVRMRRESGPAPAPMIFFTLGTACHLCTEAYYLAHLLLASWDRMPYFSVEDIGIYGSFLLFSSSLQTAMPHSGKYAPRFIALGTIFTLINAGLYVYYDTELIPAFFYFLVMGAFMVIILQSLEDMGIMSRRLFSAFAAGAALQSVLLIIDPFLGGTAKTVVLYMESILWFAALAYLISNTVIALVHKNPKALPLSFAAFLCTIFTMYMSYDPWYSVADILSATVNILMYLAVLQEVKRE